MRGQAITLSKPEVQAVATEMTMREYLQLVLDKGAQGVLRSLRPKQEKPK